MATQTQSNVTRLRINRASANPLALPEPPVIPAEIKDALKEPGKKFAVYEESWRRWREKTQNVIDQAIMALKLDMSNDVQFTAIREDIKKILESDTSYDARYNELKAKVDELQARVEANQLKDDGGIGKSAMGVAESRDSQLQRHEILLRELNTEPSIGVFHIHQQILPSDTWSINHNLGFRPNIQLRLSTGDVFTGKVNHVDDDNAVVYLNQSVAGEATCS